MKLPIYKVDAFAKELFTGNPAGVVVLKEWLNNDLMQKIATENNLAETAFVVPNKNEYEIRWFTPMVEVDLCGHATLASAFILLNYYHTNSTQIQFHSPRSGKLLVSKYEDLYELDFPLDDIKLSDDPVCIDLLLGMGAEPKAYYHGKTDCILIYENQSQIENLNPDMGYLKKSKSRGIIATAPGDEVDFVSRFFAPQSGIDEDPATGSAITSLLPYWASVLKKSSFDSKQLSKRGGYFNCAIVNGRAKIAGKAFLFLKGDIYI